MTLQQSISQCQLPNTLLLISTLGMAKAAQHKKYGCVFHRKVSTVVQRPLNVLVSVSSAGGMNVKYQHSLCERAVLGDRQRLGCWLRSEPLFTHQLQKEMAPQNRRKEMKIRIVYYLLPWDRSNNIRLSPTYLECGRSPCSYLRWIEWYGGLVRNTVHWGENERFPEEAKSWKVLRRRAGTLRCPSMRPFKGIYAGVIGVRRHKRKRK